MKNKLIIIIFISLFSLFGCLNISNSPIDKIIDLSKNKDIELLLKKAVKSNVSPSGNYIFIYAIGADYYSVSNDEDLDNDALTRDFTIDKFNFKKGEYNWWFIYDCSMKKIIIKGTGLVYVRDAIWKEKNNFFILNFSDYVFYNIKEPEKAPFRLEVFSSFTNSKTILFSDDSNCIAYQCRKNTNEDYNDSEEPLEIGIKIWDIKANKNIIELFPAKGFELEIIEWKSNKELLYQEIDLNKKTQTKKSLLIK